ncbi:MAG TPA: helix-turn-helix transcriptional regulator [Allosphingosinicella sp.]|nr:helix-turn-helix transcriptional regulator [Allosphingosinicella sp.]
MDYQEIDPPEALRPLVKAGWTLRASGGASLTVRHTATPDGCVEIIRRLEGRSSWGGAQPEAFVAGLVTRPAELELSGDARFVALRLWPWAWNRLALLPSPGLVDRWQDLAEAAPGFAMPATVEDGFAILAGRSLDEPTAALGSAIVGARTVEALARASGRSRRWLQRWFEREVGVPPRRYLRLLRFQQALTGMQESADSLALQAAEHGFADQAHMAREFRAIGRAPASAARRGARGPFL